MCEPKYYENNPSPKLAKRIALFHISAPLLNVPLNGGQKECISASVFDLSDMLFWLKYMKEKKSPASHKYVYFDEFFKKLWLFFFDSMLTSDKW